MNADDIIDRVSGIISDELEKTEDMKRSEFIFALDLLILDAFMRCKILEDPNK